MPPLPSLNGTFYLLPPPHLHDTALTVLLVTSIISLCTLYYFVANGTPVANFVANGTPARPESTSP